jgi:lipoprotein NlpD
MNALFPATVAIVAVALGGCAAPAGHRAPIIDRSVASASGTVNTGKSAQGNSDWRPQTYVVQKGDTLYSIALNFGFDYHDLAALNGIKDPAAIKVGQEIRLFPAGGSVASGTVGGNTIVSAVNPSVEIKPLDIRSQPIVAKLPYSEQAVAQIEKMQTEQTQVSTKPQIKPVPVVAASSGAGDNETVQWVMPARGKVVAGFSESDNRKGIDIAGKLGQPVSASAAGKVVYSGSGLRGYGKLVIIKHNSTYLSAYAHNNKLLVKEGQMVAKGQKIAEMGSTDANRVALHFEIRKLGKPVDPAKYLTIPKT